MHKIVKSPRGKLFSPGIAALCLLAAAGLFPVFTSCTSSPRVLNSGNSAAAVDLVTSFYADVDKGDYKAALEKLDEPEDFLRKAGTGKEEIGRTLLKEYGSSGEGVRIDHIEAECIGKKRDEEGLIEYSVAVSGLNGAGCVRYDWRTVFTLVKRGDSFKILSISIPANRDDPQRWLFPESTE